MKPLSLPRMVGYSLGNLGANMVYAFCNTGFPLFLSSYPVSNLVVGFLAQERSFVGAFVQPVVGAISDRLPPNRLGRRRPFFLIGVPLTGLSLLILATYPPLWVVLAVMTVFSFFLAVAYDPYMALLPDITAPEQRGRVGGVMALFNMLGQIAVIGLSFLLWESHQPLVFWVIASGLIAAFAVAFFSIEEPPIVRRSTTGVEKKDRSSRDWRRRAAIYGRDILGRRNLVLYLIATFVFWLGNGGIAPFITRFGVSVLGVEENVSFLLVLPAILGTAVFAVPAGLLTERYGKKRVLAAGMLLFGLITCVGAPLVQNVPQAVVLMSMVGVANAITTALIYPFLADLIPADRAGEFTGIGALVGSLAQPIGAMSAGAMADITGTLRGPFALGGAAMLVAFLVFLSVRHELDESPAPVPEAQLAAG